MTLTIRPAREDEVATVRELGRRSWIDTYADHLSRSQIKDGLAERWSDDSLLHEILAGQMLVADDGGIVGLASGGRHDPTTWVLWKLYVAPERRSQGIGGSLLEEYLERLPEDVTSPLEFRSCGDVERRFTA